ncbi:UV-B-induced protein At3g17800, chloroplastic [Capsicum annuum]|uniref:UV-B-induced protein At3g17800, chloroplastic n=1 Tax=Capsicum annuum TaxID=4072 RepID=UPI001FB0FA49|nr:UV-B-induced protein At3g17800, chloroplastic [Capsicum annuum]
MECLPLYSKISLPQYSPCKFNNTLLSSTSLFSRFIDINNIQSYTLFRTKKKSLALVASNGSGGCEFNGLTAPLTSTTEAGRLLSGIILQNDREGFYASVENELINLDCLRNDAILRSVVHVGSDEAVLHRRISELRKLECRKAVEDVMYMFIVYKFSEIGVHLVPKLSNCMYNGRLEIWPRRDWELESIHSVEVLDMVKEIGWEDELNVKDKWPLTQVQKLQIRHVYAASVLYGYFLKSASLRYHLEQNLGKSTPTNLLFSRAWQLKQKSIPLERGGDTGSTSVRPVSLIEGKKQHNLRSYITSLDSEIKLMCTKPKFKEAKSVIEKHCSALFGDGSDEEVSTSFASLKRFVLEAVAFGSFLWDAEDYVREFYRLEEN